MVEARRPAGLSRHLLGEFLKSPEAIRAFENMGYNTGSLLDVVTAIEQASVLTLEMSEVFGNARVVTSDGEVQLTDGGAGANFTIGLSDTGVEAGTYGDASHLVQIAINAKGRVTLASAFELNSDNITEGSANLFFTVERARAAISAGPGMSYDDETGVMEAEPIGLYGAPTGTFARSTFATYDAPTISDPPTQAEVQEIADHLQILSRRLAALITDLKNNGNAA